MALVTAYAAKPPIDLILCLREDQRENGVGYNAAQVVAMCFDGMSD
jgi:hypothetical protein